MINYYFRIGIFRRPEVLETGVYIGTRGFRRQGQRENHIIK